MSEVHTCLVNKLYDVICRNAETAVGGLTPTESDLHSDAFYIYTRERLEKLKGSAIDRKVQIDYKGATMFAAITNGIGGKRKRFLNIVIRVGYFTGDHTQISQSIIAGDDFAISKAICKPSNYPTCREGCVTGIDPQSSSVITLDSERQLLEISVLCQVYE